MKLQFKHHSNEKWVSCGERSEEVLTECVQYEHDRAKNWIPLTREEILQKLSRGAEIFHSRENFLGCDYLNYVRSEDFIIKQGERLKKYVSKNYETVEEFDARDDER